MAIPPLAIPAISAGTNIAGNVINGALNARQNRLNRMHSEHMYRMERQDNLADWHMQNEYNSPEQQMLRFQKAGLNKNLIYGQTSQAAPVRSADMKAPSQVAPQIDLSGVTSGLLSYYDIQQKEAQTNNLRTANTVALQDAALKAAQTAQTIASTDMTKFDLSQKNELKHISIEAAKAALHQVQQNTRVASDANERAQAQQGNTLQEQVERILTSRLNRAKTTDERNQIKAQIESIKKDTKLKELDINLKSKGVQPNDALPYRIVSQLIGDNPKAKVDTLKKLWKNRFEQ